MATTVPSFTPEVAQAIAESNLQGLEYEFPVTRKVLAAVTAPEYKLDPKGRTAFELAWHIVETEIQFLEEISEMKFSMEPRFKAPATIEEVLAFYDKKFPEAIAKMRALSPAQLLTPVDFYGAFNLPDFQYVSFALKHSVHHRGQLAAYLRPMGSKVPSIYGGSADEPYTG